MSKSEFRFVREAASMRQLYLDGVYDKFFGAAQPERRKAV